MVMCVPIVSLRRGEPVVAATELPTRAARSEPALTGSTEPDPPGPPGPPSQSLCREVRPEGSPPEAPTHGAQHTPPEEAHLAQMEDSNLDGKLQTDILPVHPLQYSTKTTRSKVNKERLRAKANELAALSEPVLQANSCGPWSEEEDMALRTSVRVLCKGTEYEHCIPWSIIAIAVPGRSGKQCRERYVDHIHDDLTDLPFERDEAEQAIILFHKYDRKWSLIARDLQMWRKRRLLPGVRGYASVRQFLKSKSTPTPSLDVRESNLPLHGDVGEAVPTPACFYEIVDELFPDLKELLTKAPPKLDAAIGSYDSSSDGGALRLTEDEAVSAFDTDLLNLGPERGPCGGMAMHSTLSDLMPFPSSPKAVQATTLSRSPIQMRVVKRCTPSKVRRSLIATISNDYSSRHCDLFSTINTAMSARGKRIP